MKLSFILIALAVSVLQGCAGWTLQPWVQPYERANFANPIMSFSRDPISDAYATHIYQAREAARGAESSGGGGCGCN